MGVLRLWPDPSATPLDPEALVALYDVPDRARPWLRVNFVSSLDGAATLDGRSAGLSGPDDKRVFGMLRMLCDALLVGAGTLRDEGYQALRLDPARRAWRLAHGLTEYPTLVVVSGRGELDPALPALADAPVRPIVVTGAGAATGRTAEVADVLRHGTGSVDLPAALDALRARGHHQVLSEGGPRLLGSLIAADLVDELCLTMSPLLAGAGAERIAVGPPAPVPRHLALRHVLSAEDALLLRYSR